MQDFEVLGQGCPVGEVEREVAVLVAPLRPNLHILPKSLQAQLLDPVFFFLGRVHFRMHEQRDAKLSSLNEGWMEGDNSESTDRYGTICAHGFPLATIPDAMTPLPKSLCSSVSAAAKYSSIMARPNEFMKSNGVNCSTTNRWMCGSFLNSPQSAMSNVPRR